MKKRGKSAAQLKALRKKYHLGEFKSGRKRRAFASVSRRKLSRTYPKRTASIPADRVDAGGSAGVYAVPWVPIAAQGGSTLHLQDTSRPPSIPDPIRPHDPGDRHP